MISKKSEKKIHNIENIKQNMKSEIERKFQITRDSINNQPVMNPQIPVIYLHE